MNWSAQLPLLGCSDHELRKSPETTTSPAVGWFRRWRQRPARWQARLLRRGRQTLGAAGLALFAHAATNLPEAGFNPSPDPRFVRLERYFLRYGCPKPQYVFEYIRAADRYGLDYRVLPALSIRETQCGLTGRQNNRWGYGSGHQSFASIEAGINYIAWRLSDQPPYKGKTLREKLFTYNPLPAYPGEIAWIMRQIESR